MKVYARRHGGSSDIAARIWYNASPTPSGNQGNRGWGRIGNETEGGTSTGYFYLRSRSLLNGASGASGESIQKTLGTSWELFDTWTMPGSSMKPISPGAVAGSTSALLLPNRVHGNGAILRLSAATTGTARVTVHDVMGREVLTLPELAIERTGVLDLPLNTTTLASGSYTVRVEIGGEVTTTMMTVVR